MCRIPIQTPVREIRVDAVAGVSHAPAGSRVRGEELLRSADASMRVDPTTAGPVATTGERLRRHARRVVEVETEIRHSLDVDLLTARLQPVVDVHSDEVVGLRSGTTDTVSSTDPFRRSLARSACVVPSDNTSCGFPQPSSRHKFRASDLRRIDADRVIDDRAVAQLGMLIRASGSTRTIWCSSLTAGARKRSVVRRRRLTQPGRGVGVGLRHRTWEPVQGPTAELDSISVSAHDLIDDEEVSALRVARLARSSMATCPG